MVRCERVTVVLLNYNGMRLGRILDMCIESLLRTEYSDFKVMFVDNGSSDGGDDYVESKYGDRGVQVVRLGKNYGYAGGNNLAAMMCRDADVVVFANTDVVFTRRWLKELVRVFEEESRVGVAQPLILNFDGSIQCFGCFTGKRGFSCLRGCGQNPRIVRGLPRKCYTCTYSHGAVLAVRSDLFFKLGGFDSDFFMYFEESDFCARCWLAGYKVVVVPRSIVYHLGGGSVASANIVADYFLARNSLWFIAKNAPSASSIVSRVMLASLARLVRGVTKSVIYRNPRVFFANVKGVVDGLRGLKKALSKRVRWSKVGYKRLELMLSLYPDQLALVPHCLRYASACRLPEE